MNWELATRLSGPWVYWQHGFWAVVGFFAVCFLMLICCAAIAGAPNVPKGHRAEFVFGVATWIAAALLLQALPCASNGIQVVPLLPWQYTGLAKAVSFVCWLCLLGGCVLAFSTNKKDLAGAPKVMLIALGFTVLLSFFGPATSVEPKTENIAVIASSQDTLAQCEKLRSQRAEALERLLSDKETLVGRIKEVGAKSKKELMANPLGRTLVEEFEHLSRQIAQLQSEIDAIDTVVERGQSSLRSLEREALVYGAKPTDEEYNGLCDADHTLAEELRRVAGEKTPGSEVNLDKLLDEIIVAEK